MIQSATPSDGQTAEDSDAIAQIREVLLGAEYEDLLALRNSLDDPIAFSEKIAAVISEAIAHRVSVDQSLSTALAPTINVAIQESISRDPQAIADSLYPVMGPAIRKSISEALAQMLEKINQLLEHSFSPKSIGWRIDAWRSGRSYSEIVLLNTLEYQVEQVFLIHKKTSLLLRHVVADLAPSKDPDLVSSMISAIQDYIHDSFSADENEHLKSMQLGDLTVLLEVGPDAIVAAVVRGSTHSELRVIFKERLERIHRQYLHQLQDYSGNPDVFATLEPSLRECLVSRNKEGQASGGRKIPWKALVLLLVLFSGLAYYFYRQWELASWRQQAINNLIATPGIVVIDSTVGPEDTLRISGLRDPLSPDPMQVAQADLPRQIAIGFKFEPYLSIEPSIVESRIANVLQPPGGVALAFNAGQLLASGTADIAWVEQLSSKWQSVHGIQSLDTSMLSSTDPVAEEIALLRALIENTQFHFESADTNLSVAGADMNVLAEAMNRLFAISQIRQHNMSVLVLGDTDNTGTENLNLRIANQRADAIAQNLIDLGVPDTVIQSSSLYDYPKFSDESRQRRVIFRITGLPENL